VLNKPAGLSSNAALQRVKRALQAKKGGHTGSLDPAATGMLPLCFGEATKASAWLLDADKTYRVVARLGESTDTGDADGRVIDTAAVHARSAAEWQATLDEFLGESEQVPPMYSALKQGGKRLYELARKGETVEREPRKIVISTIELLEIAGRRLVFRVACSKGTYVRTLVEDIARVAGTVAHTRRLHRESVAGFEARDMRSLGAVEALAASGRPPADWLLPADAALGHLGRAGVTLVDKERFLAGQVVPTGDAVTGLVRVYGPDNEFLGVGEAGEPGSVAPKRVFHSAPGGVREGQNGAVSAGAGSAVDI
jgi:tRNA pseudouridine55 synthase